VESIDNRAEEDKSGPGAYSRPANGSASAAPPSRDRMARASEDRRLLMRYHREGDPAAREALVERFLPLARQLARRYQRAGEPLDDLIQVASLGLLKAIERFDPARETAFSSFAVPTILGELKRHFRDKGWSVRVPRDLQELAVKVDRVGEDMSRELGRAPSPGEIGERIGATQEQVLEAREAAGAYRAVSLDRPRNEEDEEGELVDAFGSEDHGFELAEDAATVERLMRVLSEREREVLRLRFEEDLTQS
jgi:RNA polymerase sigma-B factor